MKKIVRIQKLFVRRVSPLSVPSHIKVRTRPGRPLIRENSWRLDRRARALLTTVNLLGWTIWLVLFGLVLTSLAWSVGVWFVRREWVEAEGIRGLTRFIENDLPVGVSFCVVFLLWAMLRSMVLSNNKVARRQAVRINLEMNAKTEPHELDRSRDVWRTAQQAQCLLCHHDEQGALNAVETLKLSELPPAQKLGLKDRLATKGR
jgi:poly-beta-1,6-N-acetyl-D-glucosamine biosynthesis protein PgaD